MKTRAEWFDTLPEPYRTQCYDNCTNLDFSYIFKSFEDALSSSFVYSKSPQGADYWINLKYNYSDIIKQTQMRTFQTNDIIFCINYQMQEFIYNYAISKNVPVFPNSLHPVNGREKYYNDWQNISFYLGKLSGDCRKKNTTKVNWLTIEKFIEYCDNWKALQKKEIMLNSNHKAIIYKENKVVDIYGQTFTFDKVKELYNACFE